MNKRKINLNKEVIQFIADDIKKNTALEVYMIKDKFKVIENKLNNNDELDNLEQCLLIFYEAETSRKVFEDLKKDLEKRSNVNDMS